MELLTLHPEAREKALREAKKRRARITEAQSAVIERWKLRLEPAFLEMLTDLHKAHIGTSPKQQGYAAKDLQVMVHSVLLGAAVETCFEPKPFLLT